MLINEHYRKDKREKYMIKRILKRLRSFYNRPLEETLSEFRDRLIHIEDKLKIQEAEGVLELRERLIHIEDKLNRCVPALYATSSFAQLGEDVMIMNFFKNVLHIKNPSYIDIGAHHPYEISNTAYFYKAGCRGINIEANPILFTRFLEERPDDLNINCGVSDAASSGMEMPFYMIDNWSGRNSFNKETVEKFIKDYPQFSLQEVRNIPMKSLNTIFEENHISSCPDYMTIDIEGLEYAALKDFDIKIWGGASVMTVEINSDNPFKDKLLELIYSSGYFLWFKIVTNYTFIRNEYKDMVLA